MAACTFPVMDALRKTADRLATEAPYQWGHMGSCNCGHLAQTVTQLSKAEIHAQALQRYGDWEQQVRDYCPTSGLSIDHIIDEILTLGFSRQDMAHLERLSDPQVLAHIPFGRRNLLKHNHRDDVILYLRAWITLLEEEFVRGMALPSELETPAYT